MQGYSFFNWFTCQSHTREREAFDHLTAQVQQLVMASGFVGVRTLPSIYGKPKTPALSSSKPLTNLKGLLGKRAYL